LLYGGDGNDTMTTFGYDVGSIALGEAGDDVIKVVHGIADGGTGADAITVSGTGIAYGNDGDDTLYLNGASSADGGEGSDTYVVDSTAIVSILDSAAPVLTG
jgi:Ca2+-binding RTX toxin-like protein